QAARDVDDEEDRQVPLLDVLLDERRTHARGDVPVDAPHVIAGLVRAHLGELHAAPLEHRVIVARHALVDQAIGGDLDAAYLAQQVEGDARAFAGRGRSARGTGVGWRVGSGGGARGGGSGGGAPSGGAALRGGRCGGGAWYGG